MPSGKYTEVVSFIPAEDIGAYLAVGLDGGICGAGELAIGFTTEDAAEGVSSPLARASLIPVLSGAAIDGAIRTLKSDADGKLIPTALATDQVIAVLAPESATATAADQIVHVYPCLTPAAAEAP